MKKATLIAILVTLSSFMFAGVNVTWGNAYTNGTDGLETESCFGVWFDINDKTSLGWEKGLKIGMAGPAGTTVRLGQGNGTSLGVGWDYNLAGGGKGWATNVGASIDFALTDHAASTTEAGDFKIILSLGLGAL